jgi:hypothetical protein
LTHGAYGIRVDGIVGRNHLLVEADAAWPRVSLEVDLEQGAHTDEGVGPESASLNLKTGGRLTVRRADGVARFATGRPLGVDELIHPFLAPVAAIMAHWERRIAFHAGAIALDGAVWGVIGERGAGKSSLLAVLAAQGVDVVADDVLVLSGNEAFTGPRTIDLREDAAGRLGGEALGVAGARPRWRVVLGALPATLPMRGWVFLGWGDEVAVDELAPSERLPRLIASLALRMPVADPAMLLPLAALPAVQFSRPADWAQADPAASSLVAALEATGARAW